MIRKFSAVPTIDTSAYAAYDLVGTKMTFDLSAFRPFRGDIVLDRVLISDKAAQGKNLDLVLFDSDPSGTTFTNNAAWALADADVTSVIAVIPVTTHHLFNTSANSVSRADNLNLGLHLPEGGAMTLYGALVAREAPTYGAATDLTVNLFVRNELEA